ncbi:hypothetical protein LINPERHAP2_LOCUS35540 [Linum perenne]
MDAGFEYKYGLEDIFNGAIQSCRENGLHLTCNFDGVIG